ncbi:MAG: DUF3883 domain-containing protein [Oligoflexus sp.]
MNFESLKLPTPIREAFPDREIQKLIYDLALKKTQKESDRKLWDIYLSKHAFGINPFTNIPYSLSHRNTWVYEVIRAVRVLLEISTTTHSKVERWLNDEFDPGQNRIDKKREYLPDSEIPDNITYEHIIDAIRDFDEQKISHKFKESTGYDVLYNERRYPPKALVGLAARYVTGQVLFGFKGGRGTKCFRILSELGFIIVPKYASKEIFVDPPILQLPAEQNRNFNSSKPEYDALYATNKELGNLGEKFVYETEKIKLSSIGRPDLAERVKWVSDKEGDGLGYDIESFDENGSVIYIEVKTTNGGINTPYKISLNEIEKSKIFGESYRIYRVFEFSIGGRIYVLKGSVDKHSQLKPINFIGYPSNL